MWELRPRLHGSTWWLPGAAAAADWLRSRVPPGGRVVVRGTPSPAFAALIHGAWAAGVCVVPINRRLTASEAEPLIRRASAALVLDDELPEFSGTSSGTEAPNVPEVDPASLALLLFTSGTSGPPKAVRLSRRAVLAAVGAAVERLALTADDRWCTCLPLDHIGGISVVLRTLVSGCTLGLHPRFDPDAVAADLATATGVSLVPTMLHRLVARRSRWPAGLRTLLIGGGPLDRQLAEDCRDLGVAPCQTYGLTECASQVCTLSPAEAADGLGTAGLPVRGMAVRLTADSTIQVRGAALMDGYEGEPSPFAADGWFTTGDLGRFDHAGRLIVLGRRDEVLISGGEHCAPHEIEAVLERHPGIREAGVYGVADREWGMRVCAVLVAVGAPLSDAEVSAACAGLADFKRPKSWRWAAALPRTALGKLQRRRLSDPA